ncbi:hypothetical protein HD806DRAFT_531889 [Xylariaceae sp. AK1471]|nr:hypothetical protein HD806DRAFT_531889 [Xylariaceae sp. AK1471]
MTTATSPSTADAKLCIKRADFYLVKDEETEDIERRRDAEKGRQFGESLESLPVTYLTKCIRTVEYVVDTQVLLNVANVGVLDKINIIQWEEWVWEFMREALMAVTVRYPIVSSYFYENGAFVSLAGRPVIRIGLNDVSVTDLGFINTICALGLGHMRLEDHEKNKALGGDSSASDSIAHELRQWRHEALNPFFSP